MRAIMGNSGSIVAPALAGILLAALPLFAAAGAAPAAPKNEARTMLEAASRKLGENKPWTTRIEKGLHIAWDTPGWGTLRADYTRTVKKPDKGKIDQDNSAYDHPFFRTYYYNGGDSWYVVNLNIGRNPNVAASMKNLVERADGIAYYLAACDTFFAVPGVPDDSLLAGARLRRAGVLCQGDTVLFDLDAKTGMLVRRIETKGGRAFLLDDYRDVQGRKMPFHVTLYENGRKSQEFRFEIISFDVKLEDAVFEENRPAAQ